MPSVPQRASAVLAAIVELQEKAEMACNEAAFATKFKKDNIGNELIVFSVSSTLGTCDTIALKLVEECKVLKALTAEDKKAF